jgi:hypothetical protein
MYATIIHADIRGTGLTFLVDGEARFDLTFNPCNANIKSLCPMKAGEPIQANGIIPVAPADVAAIPRMATHPPLNSCAQKVFC